jgi:hypothetical protein
MDKQQLKGIITLKALSPLNMVFWHFGHVT